MASMLQTPISHCVLPLFAVNTVYDIATTSPTFFVTSLVGGLGGEGIWGVGLGVLDRMVEKQEMRPFVASPSSSCMEEGC